MPLRDGRDASTFDRIVVVVVIVVIVSIVSSKSCRARLRDSLPSAVRSAASSNAFSSSVGLSSCVGELLLKVEHNLRRVERLGALAYDSIRVAADRRVRRAQSPPSAQRARSADAASCSRASDASSRCCASASKRRLGARSSLRRAAVSSDEAPRQQSLVVASQRTKACQRAAHAALARQETRIGSVRGLLRPRARRAARLARRRRRSRCAKRCSSSSTRCWRMRPFSPRVDASIARCARTSASSVRKRVISAAMTRAASLLVCAAAAARSIGRFAGERMAKRRAHWRAQRRADQRAHSAPRHASPTRRAWHERWPPRRAAARAPPNAPAQSARVGSAAARSRRRARREDPQQCDRQRVAAHRQNAPPSQRPNQPTECDATR
jgi:hypothetical protein